MLGKGIGVLSNTSLIPKRIDVITMCRSKRATNLYLRISLGDLDFSWKCLDNFQMSKSILLTLKKISWKRQGVGSPCGIISSKCELQGGRHPPQTHPQLTFHHKYKLGVSPPWNESKPSSQERPTCGGNSPSMYVNHEMFVEKEPHVANLPYNTLQRITKCHQSMWKGRTHRMTSPQIILGPQERETLLNQASNHYILYKRTPNFS